MTERRRSQIKGKKYNALKACIFIVLSGTLNATQYFHISILTNKIKMNDIQATTTTSNAPSITVYWLNESRADRILLLLEELELAYIIEKIERGPDKLAPAELKKIHPLGKSPVIKDGDKVVAESGFIIDYLIDKYGKDKNLKPTNPDDLFQYNYVCSLFIPFLSNNIF